MFLSIRVPNVDETFCNEMLQSDIFDTIVDDMIS